MKSVGVYLAYIALLLVPRVMAGVFGEAKYHDYDAYRSELARLIVHERAEEPVHISMDVVGTSEGGEPLHLIKVRRSDTVASRRILFVFGAHPRELVVVEALLFFVNDLKRSAKSGCATFEGRRLLQLLEVFELHLVPLLNPDGRRRLERTRDFCERGNGNDVDLNRNFDWEFGGVGSSAERQHEEYRGTHAFSEKEAQLIRRLVQQNAYTAAFDVHSGERQMFRSFVDSNAGSRASKRNEKNEQSVIDRVVSRGYIRNGGAANRFNSYSADGTLFDWLSSVGVPYSFVLESFGEPVKGSETLSCFEQFNPSSTELPSVLRSIASVFYTSLVAIAEIEVNDSTFEGTSNMRHAQIFRRMCMIRSTLFKQSSNILL